MPRAKVICSVTGCPNPVASRYCAEHDAEYEAKRGTSTQRGYGRQHRQTRAAWEPRVRAGTVNCARCQQPIQPGTTWHLDHTDDRTGYLGPAHATCNTSAAGKASHPTLPPPF